MAGIASSALFIVIYENKVEPIEKIIQKHAERSEEQHNPKLAYLQDSPNITESFEGSGGSSFEVRKRAKFDTFDKYNFVIIIADDLGWADVSWNNEFVKTPNLERIRKQGRTFTNLYSHSTCSPSRAALLTGIYAWRLGLDGAPFNPTKVNGIPLGVELIPEKLKKLDYKNHFIGKWHGGFCHQNLTPTERGFDSFYGFYSGAVNYLTHESKFNAEEVALDYRKVENGTETILKDKNGVYTTSDFTNQAIDKIDNFDTEGGNLLFVSYNAPHAPHIVPENMDDAYANETLLSRRRRNYLNVIFDMDLHIGRLYDKIRETPGLWDNTVLLFVSDNGATSPGGSNYPLRGMKGDYFDGGNKVPGFIVSPVFKENDLKRSTFDETVHFADLMVSLLGLADPTDSFLTDQLDGLNLWDSMIGEVGRSKRRETIYHIDQSPKPSREIQSNVFLQHANWRFNQSTDSSTVYSAAIRLDEYKYVKAVRNVRKNMYPFSAINEDWTWQSPSEITPPVMIQNRFGMPFISEEYDYWLFNLEQDPMESVNLLAFESLTEKEYLILSEMEEILEAESRRMMPQIATERYKSENEIIGAVEKGVWISDWCSSTDLDAHNLYYKLA